MQSALNFCISYVVSKRSHKCKCCSNSNNTQWDHHHECVNFLQKSRVGCAALLSSTECCSVKKYPDEFIFCLIEFSWRAIARLFFHHLPLKVLTYRKVGPTGDARRSGGASPRLRWAEKHYIQVSALFTKKKSSLKQLICESPRFELSSVTLGTQNCGPMYSKLCVTV